MKSLPPFFITGLPRSRTAWMANLFTTDKSICHHDIPFSESLTVNHKRVGFSGPELVKQYYEVEASFPGARWLVVLRKSSDARDSFVAKAGQSGSHDYALVQLDGFGKFWSERCDAVAHLCAHPNVRSLSWDALDVSEDVRIAWNWLMPEIDFDIERFNLLQHLNVQQNVPKHVHA